MRTKGCGATFKPSDGGGRAALKSLCCNPRNETSGAKAPLIVNGPMSPLKPLQKAQSAHRQDACATDAALKAAALRLNLLSQVRRARC